MVLRPANAHVRMRMRVKIDRCTPDFSPFSKVGFSKATANQYCEHFVPPAQKLIVNNRTSGW